MDKDEITTAGSQQGKGLGYVDEKNHMEDETDVKVTSGYDDDVQDLPAGEEAVVKE